MNIMTDGIISIINSLIITNILISQYSVLYIGKLKRKMYIHLRRTKVFFEEKLCSIETFTLILTITELVPFKAKYNLKGFLNFVKENK